MEAGELLKDTVERRRRNKMNGTRTEEIAGLNTH